MEQLILLIDDDKEELDILTMALDAAGLKHVMCAWAKTAEYAYHLFKHVIPDLIFLDYNMPKINGLDCLKQLKSIDRIRDVPIIFYSTSISEETQQLALETGAEYCIQKTGTIDMLADKLKQLFSKDRFAYC